MVYLQKEYRKERILKNSLVEMLEADGPYLLDIKIDKEANVLPMIEPGASVSEVTLTYK